MTFADVKAGHQFRQAPKGTKHGETIFTKLVKSETYFSDDPKEQCTDCKSASIWNAHNGHNRVHICPNKEVYPV